MASLNGKGYQSYLDCQHIIIHLYVMGEHTISQESLLTVRHVCGRVFGDRCVFSTIDLNVNPEWARVHHILVTPT